MKKIAFASGKGGAGKTSLSMSFHKYLENESVFTDCDVDAADSFLIMEKHTRERIPFRSGSKYAINTDRCSQCGECISLCRFGAVKNSDCYFIDEFSCEGCGLCEDVCRYAAVEKRENECGEIFISNSVVNTRMIHARLVPGEDNSGKLVHEVKKIADRQTAESGMEFLAIDCPPGIGCPLMAALSGVSLLVAVMECSESGLIDAVRLFDVADKMKIPFIAVTNKSGINPDIDKKIYRFLSERNVPTAGDIPFSEEFLIALNRKELVIDNSVLSENLTNIFSNIMEKFNQFNSRRKK